jgi:hypothetical protein
MPAHVGRLVARSAAALVAVIGGKDEEEEEEEEEMEFAALVRSRMRVPGAEGNVDEVVRARFFRDQDAGVLVEVGSADPEYLSVSALYRGLGWNVVAIEPNPEFCSLHRAQGHEVLASIVQ